MQLFCATFKLHFYLLLGLLFKTELLQSFLLGDRSNLYFFRDFCTNDMTIQVWKTFVFKKNLIKSSIVKNMQHKTGLPFFEEKNQP